MEDTPGNSSTAIPYSQFICIGTGFSGIGLGATIKRWYGITDVHFFEREAEVGGTWYLNSYPGMRSNRNPRSVFVLTTKQALLQMSQTSCIASLTNPISAGQN